VVEGVMGSNFNTKDIISLEQLLLKSSYNVHPFLFNFLTYELKENKKDNKKKKKEEKIRF